MARVGDGCCIKNEEKCCEKFVGIRYTVSGLLVSGCEDFAPGRKISLACCKARWELGF